MAPQLAVALHHRQRLAQLAARNAEDVAQLAFRGKTGIGRQIALRQVGAHLRQSTLSLIHAGSVVTWQAAGLRPIRRPPKTETHSAKPISQSLLPDQYKSIAEPIKNWLGFGHQQ